MAEEKNEEPKKVKVIVQNWQDGNRQFPGFKRKYKELSDIPGGSYDEKAIVVEIDADDFDEIKEILGQEGVLVQDYDQLEDEKKSFFGKVFSKVFGGKEEKSKEDDDPKPDPPKDPEPKPEPKPEPELKDLQKVWNKLFKKLSANDKRNLSSFDLKVATVDELKANIAKAQDLLKPAE
jgi:hypothetical protein